MEYLVRMRTADAGDRALIAEQRVELPAVAREDLAQPFEVDVERVGPEVRKVGVELLGVVSQTPARFFLPASVRMSSSPPTNQAGTSASSGPSRLPEGRRRRPALHQVDAQHELVVLGGEEQVLAASASAREPAAFEDVEWRVEGLERRDARARHARSGTWRPEDRARGPRPRPRVAQASSATGAGGCGESGTNGSGSCSVGMSRRVRSGEKSTGRKHAHEPIAPTRARPRARTRSRAGHRQGHRAGWRPRR